MNKQAILKQINETTPLRFKTNKKRVIVKGKTVTQRKIIFLQETLDGKKIKLTVERKATSTIGTTQRGFGGSAAAEYNGFTIINK